MLTRRENKTPNPFKSASTWHVARTTTKSPSKVVWVGHMVLTMPWWAIRASMQASCLVSMALVVITTKVVF
jgi:hypothetical protein